MYFNLFVLAFSLVLPAITLWRNGSSKSLFLSAALAWSCYGAWISLQYGLVSSFETGAATVTYNHWEQSFRTFCYFVTAFIILGACELLRTAPNKTAVSISFWGFAGSVVFLAVLHEMFTGHSYPPIWYDKLTQDKRALLSLISYYPSAVYTSSILLFLVAVIVAQLKALPTAIRYIRNL